MASKLLLLESPQQLGHLFRAVRKSQQLRQDEVGPFSHSFIGELEAGKPTAQLGKVLEALRELGLKIHVELPSGLDMGTFKRAYSPQK